MISNSNNSSMIYYNNNNNNNNQKLILKLKLIKIKENINDDLYIAKKRKGDSGDSGELEIKKGMNSKQN